mgnify:CR=1 FL=1
MLFHRQVTGLKPCYYPLAPKTISLNKITQNRGLTPHSVLYTGVYVKQKKKKPFQKRAASVTWPLRAMPAQFNRIMLFVSCSLSRATLLPWKESNLLHLPHGVVASFLSAGDCGIRTRACHRHGIPLKVIYTSRYQTRDKSISYLGQGVVCPLPCYGRPMYALSRLAATCPTYISARSYYKTCQRPSPFIVWRVRDSNPCHCETSALAVWWLTNSANPPISLAAA